MINENLTVQEASLKLGISEATCRNWIKANTLKTETVNGKKYVRLDSVEELLQNDINGRLSSRRNKTKKKGNILSINYLSTKENQTIFLDSFYKIPEITSYDEMRFILKMACEQMLIKYEKYDEDSKKLLNNIYNGEIIDSLSNLNFSVFSTNDDFLGALYMCLKKISDRKNGGMYYTPAYVVNDMFSNILANRNVDNKTIVDICCGTGNFLINAIKHGFNPSNIYGRDYDELSVEITRINIYLRTNLSYEQICNNFKQADSMFEDVGCYDICVGNPPWGSELEIDFEHVSKIYEVAETKSIDPFCIFIEKGIKSICDGGLLYYVCPETLCNVGIHKSTRKYLMKNTHLLYLSYLGNAFDGVQAPAITFCIEKEKKAKFGEGAIVKNLVEEYMISSNREENPELWNFNISNRYYNIVDKINNMSNVKYLKDNAKFALGIVTGDNKKYVLDSPTTKSSNLVKGANVYKYMLRTGEYFLEYDRNNFQQVAPDEMYFAPEKLIYRFISDTLVFTYDNAQTLSLNSANICIPYLNDVPMKYVLAILNSRIAHFVFKLNYNSVKVLRNHIESIPIVVSNNSDIETVVMMVDKLLAEKDSIKREEIYNDLDDMILKLYGLDSNERDTITNFNTSNIFLNA